MNVSITRPVKISLISMNDEDRRRAERWFDYLKGWGSDDFLAANSRKLPREGDVYELDTLTGIVIFFSVEGQEVSILDIVPRDKLDFFRHAFAQQSS